MKTDERWRIFEKLTLLEISEKLRACGFAKKGVQQMHGSFQLQA
jgi:hypothetical protein